ncbi:SDR family NAD(P)-dependent oxidoreductase [Corallococcus interemptor]|uniref:SDR family NAD(P)-dependent oxidoreductase n=1 Tax=Corallococcus interemptor TaxID=2316720 RepID=A0A3A8QMR0_9BACT|nr:SDR family NAD(P)-dependent oxidoreductase [Corallococcus interemptor]RKH69111.1 SDR family NAD(P)-dependent oxidoreductase [Corallococcus interemptor]
MTTKQQPLNSGFGATTTAREALGNTRLEGAVTIVTGGYAGIGLETTRTLHAAGATVIVPARTPDKARAALAGLEGVELEPLDLIDPASIDAFASRFLASGRPLHLLINNAGIMATPLTRDARGEAHRVRAFAVHPGGILTELVRPMSEEEVRASIENSNKIEPMKTPEQGAATTVWCATSPQLENRGGVYCENVDIAVMAPPDATIRRGVKDQAVAPKQADRLWTASEAWTGVRFNP